MVLVATMVATLAAGIGSVWLAAGLLRLGVRARGAAGAASGVGAQHLLSLAAGALLATAFMHLLPEAFESEAGAHALFATLLVGLVFFFLLDKAELWHHGHEHGQHEHGHAHGHAHEHEHGHGHGHHHHHVRGGSALGLLTGDSVHCFGDGVLIASAFLADIRLGIVAALSVLAHEVPHHIGDLVVLRQSAGGRRGALVKVTLAGAVTLLGGLAGHFLVGAFDGALPFFLVIASSSFVYVALADLVPQLQRRLTVGQTAAQVAWLLAGIAAVTLASRALHGH